MPASEFSDVFVSYRRLDVEFVKRLVEDFQKEGKEVWIDWEDIPPGVEGFADEIKRGLEGADTFIAVLSPDYLDSTYCVDMELAYAVELQKKIIPIVLKKFDDHQIPANISHINWIYFTPHAGQENTYEESFPKILEVMHTDLEHVRQHKRFLLRAIEWNESKQDNSFLLNGEEIENAQDWLLHSAGKDPIPTDLHRQYITESAKLRQRQQRLLLSGVTVALVISVLLALLSAIGFNNANQAQSTAVFNSHMASTAQSEAEINEALASTARANAEKNADLAQTAQAEAEENEDIAHEAREESERNLRDARQTQALFYGDLAQQQASRGLHQRALLLGLEAFKFHQESIISDSAYMAVHNALHQPLHRTLHLDFPKGILNVIWSDNNQQVLIASDEDPFITCPELIDCSSRVEIWDIVTQELVAYLSHESALQTVLWNQTGNQVLTLSYDEISNLSIIILWDVQTQSEIYRLSQDHYIDWLVWQSDHDFFITSERSQFSCGFGDQPVCDYHAVVYEYATGTMISTISADDEVINGRLTHDGQFLTISFGNNSDNASAVYDISTDLVVDVYDALFEHSLTWTDTNQIIAEKDNSIISQNLDTGEILYAISSSHAVDILNEMIVVERLVDCDTYETCTELQVYDARTGEEVLTTSHDLAQHVSFASIIHDGKYLLTNTDDDLSSCATCETALYLWSLETGKLLHTFDYEGELILETFDYINGVVYANDVYDLNQDETLLMTLSINDILHNLVELWDIETGESLDKVDLDRGNIQSVQFDTSNHHMVVNWDEVVEIYDIHTHLLEHTISHPSPLSDITILHDEKKVAGYTPTDFTIWEVVDWEPMLPNPIGYNINFSDQVYNERRSQLLTWLGSESQTPNAHVWDVETGQLLFTLETGIRVLFASWSPNERQIVLSHPLSECDGNDCHYGLSVFNARTGEHQETIEVADEMSFFSWIPDTNHLLYSSVASNSTLVLDINNGGVVYSSDEYGLRLSQWSSDYSQFAVPNVDDFTYSIIDYPSNEIIQSLPISARNFGLNWVNDDQIIVVLEETPTTLNLVGYDVASGEEVYRIDQAGIYQVSYDSSQILMLTDDTQLINIESGTGEIIWTSPILNEQWTDIIWSPDDEMAIISGFFAAQAQLFDIETGEALTTFPYSEMVWSPDSRRILAYDDNVEPEMWRVYDVNADRVSFSFQASSNPIWSHDSRSLASHDGIWSVDFGDLINRGEERRVRELTELELQEFFIKAPSDKPQELAQRRDIGQEPSDDDDDDD